MEPGPQTRLPHCSGSLVVRHAVPMGTHCPSAASETSHAVPSAHGVEPTLRQSTTHSPARQISPGLLQLAALHDWVVPPVPPVVAVLLPPAPVAPWPPVPEVSPPSQAAKNKPVALKMRRAPREERNIHRAYRRGAIQFNGSFCGLHFIKISPSVFDSRRSMVRA